MKPPTLFRRHRRNRISDQHIGCTEPVGAAIVTSVIARALGLILVPLLGNRHATDHGMIDAGGVHGLNKRVRPF